MSKNFHRSSVTVFLLTLLLVACQGGSPQYGQAASTDNGSYTVVTAQELQSMLEEKDFTMINVHIPWQGDIPQTDLRLAYDQIAQSAAELPADMDSRIMVYCLTSGMARIAVDTLLGMGYTDVWTLDGGTAAWEEAGFVLEED